MHLLEKRKLKDNSYDSVLSNFHFVQKLMMKRNLLVLDILCLTYLFVVKYPELDLNILSII